MSEMVYDSSANYGKELILANSFNINFFINRKRHLEKHKEDQWNLLKILSVLQGDWEEGNMKKHLEMQQLKFTMTLKSVKVTLQLESGTTMTFYPRQGSDEDNSVLEDDNLKQQKDLKLIQSVIHIKDKYRISDEAFHELHMLGASIPSKNNIVFEKKRLNSTLELYTNPSPNVRKSEKNYLKLLFRF